MPEPLVYTVEEVASLLAISRGTAYAGVRAGEIPSVHVGRSIRVPKAALDAMLGIPNCEPTLELLKNDDAPGGQPRRGARICSTEPRVHAADVLRAA